MAQIILQRWQPLPKVGLVDDIAEAALFLASDAARLINGHNLIIIDGGITAGWPAVVAREDLQRFRTRFRAENEGVGPLGGGSVLGFSLAWLDERRADGSGHQDRMVRPHL